MKKAILGLAMIGLIAPASLQAENSSCGWLHYAAGGLTVAGAAGLYERSIPEQYRRE